MSTATQPLSTTNGTAATKMSNPKKSNRSWWRPLVDGIDRKITPPANSLVRTSVFADTVATVTRLEVRVRRRVERQSNWLLHQYNLPTAGDIRKMRSQLAAIEARVRDMSERLEDQQLEARRQGATKARAARSTGAKGADGSR